jgi:hypothetical protein
MTVQFHAHAAKFLKPDKFPWNIYQTQMNQQSN